jgi:hypothetical protein
MARLLPVMSDEQGGGLPPQPDADRQRLAKLQGLERMRTAGLIAEPEYQRMLAKLEDGGRAAAPSPLGAPAAPAPRRQTQYFVNGTAPEAPEAPGAEPELTPGSTATPEPAGPASVPPGMTPPPAANPMGRKGIFVAAGLCVTLLGAAAGVGLLVTRSSSGATAHSASTVTPPPTPLPDPANALTPLRGITASTPDVVIDQPGAEKFVRAFWPVREEALSNADPNAVRALENGPAGEWDAVGCTMGCAPPSPRNIRDLHLFVPKQATYPASFMAEVLTTAYHGIDPLVEIMIFTRQSAGATWFLTFNTNYGGVDHLFDFAHPDSSSAFESLPNGDPGLDRNALPGMLAAYWQHWKDQGTAPAGTRFVPGYFTNKTGQDFFATRTDMHKGGIDEHVSYTADPARDGIWSFAINFNAPGTIYSNAVLTCGTVRYRNVSTPAPPATSIVQGKNFDTYGTLLAPGQYGSVTENGLHESCFLTNPGQAAIAVEGMNGSQTSVAGIPLNGGTAALSGR